MRSARRARPSTAPGRVVTHDLGHTGDTNGPVHSERPASHRRRSDAVRPQATFIGNITLLGATTAALGAIAGSREGEYGSRENGTLAVGLDAGLLAGALIAPRLDWSARRSRLVLAATGVGAMIGGMLAGLTTRRTDGSESEANADVVAACMTAGMWGGFGLGILMTRDSLPDPKFSQPSSAGSTPTTYAPWVGDNQLGILAGGTW